MNEAPQTGDNRPEMNQARLEARLAEDLGPAEAARLRPVARQLARWPAPEPTLADTARLVACLQPEIPAPARRDLPGRLAAWWPGLLLRSQLRVVRGEIWASSALVMTLGVLVSLAMAQPGAGDTALPFLLTAPLVAGVGVGFLYGPANDPAVELELATPASPRLILLARLALLFGFNLLLGLAGSLALALLHAQISLWPLVMAWLAPMAFLSALAFLVSVISTDPTLSVLLSLLLWMAQVIRRFPVGLEFVPDLLAPQSHPWLWAGAALLAALAAWLGGRQERWLSLVSQSS